MKKPIAGIINISINNILSIKRALEFIGFDTVLINEHVPIEKFDLIVLPGVGAFNEAMNTLNKSNLLKTIDQALIKNKKFLGICLGMQLLFEQSNEFVKTKGIGFFNGKVESFKGLPIYKKTFIGWNKVNFNKKFFMSDAQYDLLQNKAYYFVHSFFVNCTSKHIEFGNSINGELTYSSVVKKDNVTAFQFHPEKSGTDGLNLLKTIKREI
jgi:imidazole glycerol-phosphate synthase subunit HisH